MADYYVKNQTNPVASSSDLGTRVTGVTPADAIAAYTAIHAANAGDSLRVVQYTSTVNFFLAASTIVVNPATAPAQPAVGS